MTRLSGQLAPGTPFLMEATMTHFVGLDVSKATTSICVIDREGKVVREATVETAPAAIVGCLRGERRRYRRIGLEATSFAPWLYEGIAKAGLPIICIEARHAHGVLKSRLNKTDRNDARGIAELMRVGIYKAVHTKTRESQAAKLLLTTRGMLRRKQCDFDNLIRATLLQHGLKLSPGAKASFGRRAAALAASHPLLNRIVGTLLEVHDFLGAKAAALEAQIEDLVREDAVCQRFLTVPGVGPLTALAFRSAIDVPERFSKSRNVGVHLGLTSRAYRSGTIDRQGRISKCGDAAARTALFNAAQSVLRPTGKRSELKTWARELLKRKEYYVAAVAVARRLAVILHRMWLDGADFNPGPTGV
jgi:transposase